MFKINSMRAVPIAKVSGCRYGVLSVFVLNTSVSPEFKRTQGPSSAWNFFGKLDWMNVVVAENAVGGDKEALVLNGNVMPQVRYPNISTSVSGIANEDWEAFTSRARQDNVKYQDAITLAIKDLAVAARRGDRIEWKAAKNAPSRPLRMHDDTRILINELVKEFSYKQNIIVGTAMHMWANRPSV